MSPLPALSGRFLIVFAGRYLRTFIPRWMGGVR